MYVADAFGYLAYVALMFTPRPAPGPDGLLGQFMLLGWGVVVLAAACILLAWRHLARPAQPIAHEPAIAAAR
jgi:hypothetical protein